MKKHYVMACAFLLPMVGVHAGELGVGKGNDIPDAAPTDPMETEAHGGWFEQLLEWFELGTE